MTLVPTTTREYSMPTSKKAVENKILELLKSKGPIAPSKTSVAIYLKAQLGYRGSTDAKAVITLALISLKERGLVKLTPSQRKDEFDICELIVQPEIAIAQPPAIAPIQPTPLPAEVEVVKPATTTPATPETPVVATPPKEPSMIEQLVVAGEEQQRLHAADKIKFERQLTAKNNEMSLMKTAHSNAIIEKNQQIEELSGQLRASNATLDENAGLNASLRGELEVATAKLETALAELEAMQENDVIPDELVLRAHELIGQKS